MTSETQKRYACFQFQHFCKYSWIFLVFLLFINLFDNKLPLLSTLKHTLMKMNTMKNFISIFFFVCSRQRKGYQDSVIFEEGNNY